MVRAGGLKRDKSEAFKNQKRFSVRWEGAVQSGWETWGKVVLGI